MRASLLLPALLGLASAPVAPTSGGVGQPLPAAELEGFAQTGASSLEDFFGRALLIEFFAYW